MFVVPKSSLLMLNTVEFNWLKSSSMKRPLKNFLSTFFPSSSSFPTNFKVQKFLRATSKVFFRLVTFLFVLNNLDVISNTHLNPRERERENVLTVRLEARDLFCAIIQASFLFLLFQSRSYEEILFLLINSSECKRSPMLMLKIGFKNGPSLTSF